MEGGGALQNINDFPHLHIVMYTPSNYNIVVTYDEDKEEWSRDLSTYQSKTDQTSNQSQIEEKSHDAIWLTYCSTGRQSQQATCRGGGFSKYF